MNWNVCKRREFAGTSWDMEKEAGFICACVLVGFCFVFQSPLLYLRDATRNGLCARVHRMEVIWECDEKWILPSLKDQKHKPPFTGLQDRSSKHHILACSSFYCYNPKICMKAEWAHQNPHRFFQRCFSTIST